MEKTGLFHIRPITQYTQKWTGWDLLIALSEYLLLYMNIRKPSIIPQFPDVNAPVLKLAEKQ